MSDFQEIRSPAVAGQFYPAATDRLQAVVDECLAAGKKQLRTTSNGSLRALIVPHAGYQFSGSTAGAGYALLQAELSPAFRRFVVFAPSHRSWFRGVALGGFSAFDTPLGAVPVDVAACKRLLGAHRLITDRPNAHVHEHALEVQLPFLHSLLPQAALVPVVCGEMTLPELRQVAGVFAEQFSAPETLWVISSDFTHYGRSFGYVPFTHDIPKRLEELDRGAIDKILELDCEGFLEYVDRTGATICGRTPIALLLAALERCASGVSPSLVHYTTSGALTHDYQHTVSYAAIAVFDQPPASAGKPGVPDLTNTEKRVLLDCARDGIRSRFSGRPASEPETDEVSSRLTENGAAFVTLKKNGALRGCIGSLEPVQPLIEDVIQNAGNAAFYDSRFHAVTENELDEIDIEITVLTPCRPVATFEDIEIGRHGIVIEKNGRRAVFLPQVPIEEGWDLETTLRFLSMKAGLGPEDWRRGARFEVFEAIIFGEK